MFFAAFFAKS